jgi:hypothetical protein
MLVRMKKISGGLVLTCLREASQAEVQRTGHGGFFALHDLLHYAVETTLGFDRAFLGLMASGWSFENFTRHDDPRYRAVSTQAVVAEHLVGILSQHLRDYSSEDDEFLELLSGEINRDLAAIASERGVAMPTLSAADVASIYATYQALAERWAKLPVGEHLELAFPATRVHSGD